jgi:hypothetical protein
MKMKLLVAGIVVIGAPVFLVLWISSTYVLASTSFTWTTAENSLGRSTSTPGGLYLLAKGGGNAQKGGGVKGGNSPGFPDADVGDWDYTLPDYSKGGDDSSSNSRKDSKTKSEDD